MEMMWVPLKKWRGGCSTKQGHDSLMTVSYVSTLFPFLVLQLYIATTKLGPNAVICKPTS